MKTVLIYVNTSADVGDVDHLKVFANELAAEKWFAENDPEGVAFEYEVLREPHRRPHHHVNGTRPLGSAGPRSRMLRRSTAPPSGYSGL
jgi:hypothetical protein